MEKVTLTKVSRTTTNKEGDALINKSGKPYTRLSIKTDTHGVNWLGGFDNAQTKDWKEGDQIEIEVTQKGEYLNFKVPKVEDKNADMLIKLSMQVGALQNDMRRLIDRLDGVKKVDYPTPEDEGINLDEAPF